MRKYETVVIYGNELSDVRIKEEVQKIENFLSERSVTSEVARWGAKQLAFTIAKRKTGHYVCFAYETDRPEVPAALGAFIKISDVAIRFQTHRLGLPTRKIKVRPGQTEQADDFEDDYSDRGFGDRSY